MEEPHHDHYPRQDHCVCRHHGCRNDRPSAATGRRAGQALAPRLAQRQGRRRLLHDVGQTRLCRKAGPQARPAAGEGRPDRPQGADRRRGRQFRRRPAGRLRRRRARRRRQDHRLSLGGGAARHLCARRHPQSGRSQGQVDRGVVAEYDAGSAGAFRAGEIRHHRRPGEARRRRRRPRALSGAGRRRGRGRRGVQRISAGHAQDACIC